MPLKSLMLQGDSALQSCLVDDRAHVTSGTVGNHVSKIQRTLLLLDGANIDLAELRSKKYGPSTAAAVLKYKQKRRIVNLSYQKTADNIVGKMTIARMDDELFELDGKGSRCRTGCRGARIRPANLELEPKLVRPLKSSEETSARVAPRRPVTRRHNVKLSILIQETTAAAKIGGGFQFVTELIAAARQLMAPHAIDFEHGPFALPCFGASVPDDDDKVLIGSDGVVLSLRELAAAAQPISSNTLRVILCPFSPGSGGSGFTGGGRQAAASSSATSMGPRFCLIDIRARRPDSGTLLHEMIHAANPIISPGDTDIDPKSIFSHSATAFRTFLSPKRATELVSSFFSR